MENENWVTRKTLLQNLNAPILFWNKNMLENFNHDHWWSMSNFFITTKKTYESGEYDDAVLIDSKGCKYRITQAKLKNFSFHHWTAILAYIWPLPNSWPRKVEVRLKPCSTVSFEVLKNELVEFIDKNKWYRQPNQGMTLKEQYQAVEKASVTETFTELFEAVGWMMSPKYRREIMDGE